MKGDYSEHLTIQSAIGWIGGRAVSTASVSYPREDPEAAVVGSVLTHPAFRSLGIAGHLTNLVVKLGFDAGCKVCFLGATRDPRSVYLRCGFKWWNGGVMRRAAVDDSEIESRFFAPDQRVLIRDANWGDLPGMACLVIQPLDCMVIDYPRGLLSGKYVSLQRCVSNFPAVWYPVKERGGEMIMLVGEASHRILGFGTLTPGPAPGQTHKAILDVATHSHYSQEVGGILQELLHKAAELDIETVQACVAGPDEAKRAEFERLGMRPVGTFPNQIRIGHQRVDVTILEGRIV
jgi:GNAT superfamily N-acetyltransferase